VRFAASNGDVVTTDSPGLAVPDDLVRAAESSTSALAQTMQIDNASYLVVAVPVVSSVDAESAGLIVYSFTPLAAQNAVQNYII
jgi:hypothetical protein